MNRRESITAIVWTFICSMFGWNASMPANGASVTRMAEKLVPARDTRVVSGKHVPIALVNMVIMQHQKEGWSLSSIDKTEKWSGTWTYGDPACIWKDESPETPEHCYPTATLEFSRLSKGNKETAEVFSFPEWDKATILASSQLSSANVREFTVC